MIQENYKKILGIASASARNVLGNSSGSDLTSWAEDIAQDTIVYLLEKEQSNALRSEFAAYYLAEIVARRKALNFKRQEERRRNIESEHGAEINNGLTGQSAELLSAQADEIVAYEEMRDRLDELSPLLYNTVEAHYINGRSVEEIADEEGVTVNVIHQRLHRAREVVTGDNNNE
jgi:RNA polymerase sigma factor (sigma-70 family)